VHKFNTHLDFIMLRANTRKTYMDHVHAQRNLLVDSTSPSCHPDLLASSSASRASDLPTSCDPSQQSKKRSATPMSRSLHQVYEACICSLTNVVRSACRIAQCRRSTRIKTTALYRISVQIHHRACTIELVHCARNCCKSPRQRACNWLKGPTGHVT
jgi:hypothetical protein